MNAFTRRTIEIIRAIPEGRVTTYGAVAAAAGSHCGARQVARILHSGSDLHHLPWHRVINRNGEISPRRSMSHIDQRRLLEQEGVVFDERDTVDFDRFLWLP